MGRRKGPAGSSEDARTRGDRARPPPLPLATLSRRLALLATVVLFCASAAEASPKTARRPARPPEATSAKLPVRAQPTPNPRASDDEVVEVIDDPVGAPVATAPPPAPAPPTRVADRMSFTGWTRTFAELGLAGDQSAGDPAAAPYDRFVARQQLLMGLRYEHDRRWEAVASGTLLYSLFKRDSAHSAGFETDTAKAGYFEPRLQEAYLGVFWPHVDLRVGLQRVPWGRSDAFPVHDVINSADLRDPMLGETELTHIPTLQARADWHTGPGDLQLLFSPFFTPSRMDVFGRNWAKVQPGAPAVYRALYRKAMSVFDPSLSPSLQMLLAQTRLPPDDLSGAQLGARYSTTAAEGIDVDFYYHYGYDPTPKFTIDPAQVAVFADPGATLASMLSGAKPFAVNYERRHHLGASATTAVGSMVLRGELAYDSRRVFTRRSDLQGLALPTLQGVFGVEYQTGDLGKTLMAELMYQRIVDPVQDGELLGSETDQVALATLARWTFHEHLELELRALGGVAPSSYTLRPQVAWKEDAWAVRLGLLLLGGEEGALPQYFERNRAVYVSYKWSL